MANEVEIKLSADAAEAIRNIGAFTKQYNALIKEVSRPLKKIDTFQTLEKELQSSGKAIETAKNRLKELGNEILAASNPSKELLASYRNQYLELGKLDRAEASRLSRLQKLRTELKASGIDTANLAAEQKKLTAELNRRTAQKTQGQNLGAAAASLGVVDYQSSAASAKTLQQQFDMLRQSGTLTSKEMAVAQNTLQQKLAENTERMRAMVGATDNWRASLTKIKGAVVASAAALGSLSIVGAKSFSVYAGFEQQMARINSVTNLSESELEGLKGQVRDLGIEMGKTSEEMAAGLFDILGSGVPEGDAMEALAQSTKAAVAGMVDTDVAARVGITSINSYGEGVDKLGLRFDQLFKAVDEGVIEFSDFDQGLGQVLPIAAAAGVSFEEVTAALGRMTQQGMKPAQAFTALRGAISQLSAPSKQAAETMKRLGIEYNGFSGTLQQIAKLNLGVADISKLIPDVEGRTAVLSLTQNLEAFLDLSERMESAGGSTQRAYDIMRDTPSEQVKQFVNALKGLQEALGEAIAAGLPLLNLVTDMINAFNKLPNGIRNAIAQIVVLGATGKTVSFAFKLLKSPAAEFAASLSGTTLATSTAQKAFTALPKAVKPVGENLQLVADLASIVPGKLDKAASSGTGLAKATTQVAKGSRVAAFATGGLNLALSGLLLPTKLSILSMQRMIPVLVGLSKSFALPAAAAWGLYQAISLLQEVKNNWNVNDEVAGSIAEEDARLQKIIDSTNEYRNTQILTTDAVKKLSKEEQKAYAYRVKMAQANAQARAAKGAREDQKKNPNGGYSESTLQAQREAIEYGKAMGQRAQIEKEALEASRAAQSRYNSSLKTIYSNRLADIKSAIASEQEAYNKAKSELKKYTEQGKELKKLFDEAIAPAKPKMGGYNYADELRRQGKELAKSGDFQGAIEKYKESLAEIQELQKTSGRTTDTEDFKKELQKLALDANDQLVEKSTEAMAETKKKLEGLKEVSKEISDALKDITPTLNDAALSDVINKLDQSFSKLYQKYGTLFGGDTVDSAGNVTTTGATGKSATDVDLSNPAKSWETHQAAQQMPLAPTIDPEARQQATSETKQLISDITANSKVEISPEVDQSAAGQIGQEIQQALPTDTKADVKPAVDGEQLSSELAALQERLNAAGLTVKVTPVVAADGSSTPSFSDGTAKGFARGGYTGPGHKYLPAGIVHAGEYVMPRSVTRQPGALAVLERIHRDGVAGAMSRLKGFADGGIVPALNATELRIPAPAPAPAAKEFGTVVLDFGGGNSMPAQVTPDVWENMVNMSRKIGRPRRR